MRPLSLTEIRKKRKTSNNKANEGAGQSARQVVNQSNTQGSTSLIINNLQELITLFPSLPNLLSGPPRHLKVEPHYREPTSRLLRSRQEYRETSKIRLTGNWIEKAGFITHERIRVIPMDRMLIIIPEESVKKKNQKARKLNSLKKSIRRNSNANT